ncbi:MAG TPA: hypothetical protein VJM11_14760 [Nevskiaceae bacterium]|nr:hypothetical protein [Nevskiaceae bacterium]
MSHEQLVPGPRPTRSFGQKSDKTFWIILGVGVALVAMLALLDYVSNASATARAPKQDATVQAKTSTADPVYKCADGRVSFKPCS